MDPSETGLPFPWNDCYLSTFNMFEARVRKTMTDQDPQYEVEINESLRVEDLLYEDGDRWKSLYKEKHNGELPPHLFPLPPTLDLPQHNTPIVKDHRPAEDENLHGDANADVEDSGSYAPLEVDDDDAEGDVSDSESESGSVGDIIAAMVSKRPTETMPVVTVTHDLSVLDEVNDPQDFFEEVKALYK